MNWESGISPVSRFKSIDSQSGRVSGVTLNSGETLKAATVVSNSDCVRTCEELLPKKVADKFMSKRKFEAACSGVVLYLGLRKKYEHILHHNFVFSRDPHVEFDQIYTKGEPAADPTCYVHCVAVGRQSGSGKWRGVVRSRSHTVSAKAPRLESDAAVISQRHH